MPTTPYLGITQLTTSQTGKENTINNAIAALEAAGNATLAVSMAAGNVTLSVAQFTGSMIFNTTGLTAARVLNIPALVNGVNTSRIFGVRNSGTFPVTVQITGGAGTNVIVSPSFTLLLNVDGAGNVAQTSMVAIPYHFGGGAVANIDTDEVLMDHVSTEAFTLAANFVGSRASVGTNPTVATWVATVKKNGTTIGTISITSAGVVTFATTGGVSVAVAIGDVISLHAPTPIDATIARFRWTFKGIV